MGKEELKAGSSTVTAVNRSGTSKKGKQISMFLLLILLTIVPVVALTIGVIITVRVEYDETMTEAIYRKLQVASEGLATSYEYDITDEASAQAIFDETDYTTIDSLKEEGIEQTIFVGDTRASTSVLGEDGKRVVNTKAADGIWDTVSAGNSYQARGVKIGTDTYYVYYSPLHTEDGKIIGMAFAGEKESMVRSTITEASVKIGIIILIIAAILILVVVFLALRLTRLIRQVVDEANRLASGDLKPASTKIMESSVRDLHAIMDSVKAIRESFGNIIASTSHQLNNVNTDMGGMGESVQTGMEVSSVVTGAVSEITTGATETAESIQNVTESMQEISMKIDSIAKIADTTTERTNEIKSVSEEASRNLGSLMDANKNTISASEHVVAGIINASEASQKISEVVQTVEEIAEETKLLSLNASIEAARAGEAGRGFAVVADSIQGLASQSTNSVNEIRGIIEEITKASDNNVRLANEIKGAINSEGDILKDVSKSFKLVTDRVEDTVVDINSIKEAANELDASKEKVLDEVSSLSALSEETAASCQQTSSSMQELNDMMEGINESTAKTRGVCDEVISTMDYFKMD